MNKKTGEKKTRTRRTSKASASVSVTKVKSRTNVNEIIQFHEQLKCKNKTQKDLIASIEKNDVTICVGPAGTGKTLISIYEALRLLKANSTFQKIVLIKSVTTLKDESVGFLKGTLDQKLEPVMYSFMYNFEKLIGKENTETLTELKMVESLPIAYLRGINIDNAIILIDEAQNITHDNMKTILTRLGENSKMVFLGDIEQIDLRNKKDSSMLKLIGRIRSKPTDGVNVIEFNKEDILRHKLTSYFIDLFNEDSEK